MKFFSKLLYLMAFITSFVFTGNSFGGPLPPLGCSSEEENCVCDENNVCTLVNMNPPPLSGPRRTDLLVGFFGSAGNSQYGFDRFNEDCLNPAANPSLHQAVETAAFVNVIFEAGWGDWGSVEGRRDIMDCMVQRMIEAKSLGVKKAFVMLDFIVYSVAGQNQPFIYRGQSVADPELRYFFKEITRHGLGDMVAAFYPTDEPGEYGISDETVRQVNGDIRRVAAEFPELAKVPLAVIYSPRSQPGFDAYDWIGLDDYNSGDGVIDGWYTLLLSRMTETQKLILVPGPAFRQDPSRFYKFAEENERVAAILSFIWFDGWNGPSSHGARSNGWATAYCIMGKRIIDPKVDYPNCITPQPKASLRVNGEQRITVSVGDMLHYRWNAVGGKTFGSYWLSDNPSCSFGYLGAQWSAQNAEGGEDYPVMKEQAGCTYVITYTVCGEGAKCTASPIIITVRPLSTDK